MIAHIGDRLVLEGTHLGDARRVGTITAVGHADGGPPYEVQWVAGGAPTLIFPGPGAHVVPAGQPDQATAPS